MCLFWLNTKSSCLDCLQSSWGWLKRTLPNYGYLIWWDEVGVARWGWKGFALPVFISLTLPPPSPITCFQPPHSTAVTAKLSADHVSDVFLGKSKWFLLTGNERHLSFNIMKEYIDTILILPLFEKDSQPKNSKHIIKAPRLFHWIERLHVFYRDTGNIRSVPIIRQAKLKE